MEVVLASSSLDGGIGCWDLHTGAEQLRYKSCSSPSHGLVAVGPRFIASSQLREPSATSGSVLFWSWSKVWSLSRGTLLRNIVFPSHIDSIVLDPAEHVFYAGSRDGKIFIAALSTESVASNNCGMHIVGSFSNQRLSFLLLSLF
ncbi:hypothetical protein V8G54_017902 [Vigna mungo]|uniref:Uncharacterized protein n=1 Tax=Vigna mungo TaxID=3915 RepID=A0AAQ3N8F3_VIGMU